MLTAYFARERTIGVSKVYNVRRPRVGVEVQAVLRDVLHDAIRHEVPNRLAARDAFSAVRGRDGERWHLDQADLAVGQTRVDEGMAWPGDPDEVSHLHRFL